MITNIEFQRQVIESLMDGSADIQTDNYGQLIIYTNIFEWTDGSLHEEEEVMEVGDDEYQLSDGE